MKIGVKQIMFLTHQQQQFRTSQKITSWYWVNILNLSIGMWVDIGTKAYYIPDKEVHFEMKKIAN